MFANVCLLMICVFIIVWLVIDSVLVVELPQLGCREIVWWKRWVLRFVRLRVRSVSGYWEIQSAACLVGWRRVHVGDTGDVLCRCFQTRCEAIDVMAELERRLIAARG